MPQLAPLSWILVPMLLWFVLISLSTFGHYMQLLHYPQQNNKFSKLHVSTVKWFWGK